MTSLLAAAWDRIRTSLWFIPAVMLTAAALLSFGSIAVDRRLTSAIPLAYGGAADGARAVLSTIATSMVTVAGVVFSITIVALALASQQFGPRVLRNFMQDVGNQIVLGTFIATFVYCLLTIRTIRSADEREFVPHLSVTIGVVLAVASLSVLIYFVHHVSKSINAETVIARVSAELHRAVDRLYPEVNGDADAREGIVPQRTESEIEVRAKREGYLEMIDSDALLALARRHDLLVRVELAIGSFVRGGDILARVSGANMPDARRIRAVARAFTIGISRTPVQDVEFPLHQLVQVAVRTLSPSTNDPFTAIAAIDRIVAGLRRLGGRPFPSTTQTDQRGIARVVAPRRTFAEIAASTLAPLSESAARSPTVVAHLRQSLADAAADLQAERAAALRGEIRRLDELSHRRVANL